MSNVVFRLAEAGEESRIIEFVNSHFDMQLPLMNRPELFHHYYAGQNGRPQFALAEEDGILVSAAGYILANCTATPDVWVSVWVAAKGHNGVGLELMNAIPRLTGARVVACNNIRPATCTFYRFLGWTAERLPHYYRLAQKQSYALATPGDAPILATGGDLTLEKVPDAAALIPLGMPTSSHTPAKDSWYLMRRYFHYPVYRYDVWAAKEAGQLLAYAVTRTVSAQATGSVPVVRLVDFIGADAILPRIGKALDDILQAAGGEYMDCYCAGIPAEVWAAAGFTERANGSAAKEGGVCIPNYLEPPLLQNTEYYYFTNAPENFVMFKADGDQDRPNFG